MGIRETFATVCGLTCAGGSEKRLCACAGPAECQARDLPGFADARNAVIDRMGRYLMNGAPPHLAEIVLDEFAREEE